MINPKDWAAEFHPATTCLYSMDIDMRELGAFLSLTCPAKKDQDNFLGKPSTERILFSFVGSLLVHFFLRKQRAFDGQRELRAPRFCV